jgi:lycopene cyclase domain-containing protein
MNEYTIVASAMLLVVAVLAGVRGVYRQRWVLIGLLVFGTLTIIVDVLLTRIGVYRHRAAFNAGILIDQMPIEDLLYGLALYLVAVLSWSWSERGEPHGR